MADEVQCWVLIRPVTIAYFEVLLITTELRANFVGIKGNLAYVSLLLYEESETSSSFLGSSSSCYLSQCLRFLEERTS